MSAYRHVRSLLFGTPLAVTHARFEELAAYLDARGTDAVDLASPITASSTPTIEVQEGVAIVPIRGTLTRRTGAMASLSGLTSYDDVVGLVEDAATRPDVQGIVLAFDSPGGAVAGVLEAADSLRVIAADLPVYAVADGLAASAAYWLAIQARQFYVSPSAEVGSIGIFAVRDDASQAEAQQGRSRTVIKSGALKGAGDPKTPLSDAERADLQRQVDELAGLFFGAVAGARRMTPTAVAALEGATFMGDAAVKAGLADKVGTVAEAVAAMQGALAAKRRLRTGAGQFVPATSSYAAAAAAAPASSKQQHRAMTKGQRTMSDPNESNVIDLDDARVREHVAAKTAEAVQAALERDREIRGLCALFGCSDKAERFLKESKTRAEVYELLQAEKVKAEEAQPTRGAFAGRQDAPAAGALTGGLDPRAIFAKRAKDVTDLQARRAAQLRA